MNFTEITEEDLKGFLNALIEKTELKEVIWKHNGNKFEIIDDEIVTLTNDKISIYSHLNLNDELGINCFIRNNLVCLEINNIKKPFEYYDMISKLSPEDRLKELSDEIIQLDSGNPIYTDLIMQLYQSISNDRLKLVKATDTNVALIKVLKQWRVNGRENIIV